MVPPVWLESFRERLDDGTSLQFERVPPEDETSVLACLAVVAAAGDGLVRREASWDHWSAPSLAIHLTPATMRNFAATQRLYAVYYSVANESEEGSGAALSSDTLCASFIVGTQNWTSYFYEEMWSPASRGREVLYLGKLGVLPGVGRRGIGKAVLRACDRIARELGCVALRLDAVTDHGEGAPPEACKSAAGYASVTGLREFYLSTGWTDVGCIDKQHPLGPPGRSIHLVLYEKVLPA
jgi:GNAT superfamily N-acetyltransferase